ncbi:hypothetical protein ACHAPT_013587 [Fusarium lateritium]
MCKSNSPNRICRKDVAEYVARRDAGVKSPKIFFCHDIRGAVLMALLDRADESPSGSPGDKPDFDRQEHVKWLLREAVIHGALVSTPGGWKRAPGVRFLDEQEAGEWLQMKLDGASNNELVTMAQPKVPAHPAFTQPAPGQHKVQVQPRFPVQSAPAPAPAHRQNTLASSRWANKPTLPDMNRLSLNDTRVPMFPASKRGSYDSCDKFSSAPAVSRSVEEWRNKVSAASPPRTGRAELKERLERIGRERLEQLDRMQKGADEEGELWSQM